MKKVNLDEEFEKFKERNSYLDEGEELEEAWQQYQENEGLYDISNTDIDEHLDEGKN